ncbi:MAG: double-strand break repair helicase AddA [Rhodobacterales bacterium]
MTPVDDATLAQIRAADPKTSTWVSANAGSGKTRVLTDRVARLLLQGTDPQKILCLTYTNAAAAEMQNRLFKRLGAWAMMHDDDLRTALLELGEDKILLTAPKLRQARTLFATALETPGGLKIQTIHAFCDALLRQFPLEAHVSPQFEIFDDRQAAQVRADILEHLAEGNARAAFERLAELYTGFDPDSLLQAIAKNHRGFMVRPTHEDFGLMPDMTVASIAQHAVTADDLGVLRDMIPILLASSSNDQKLGRAFDAAIAAPDTQSRLQVLAGCMLDKSRYEAKVSNTPTKAVREANVDLAARLHHFMKRIEVAREALISAKAYDRAIALYDFAKPFLAAYEQYKLLHGLLDYQDLIEKAQGLLQNSSMADWVLFRLDGGIDHILVDEAQDTSPDQWRLIERLTNEFTSGLGASDVERTVFVVGDEKQSIYSFQGADPKYFGKIRDWFDTRLAAIESRLEQRELLHSFRSADPILRLVDNTFVGDARKGIIGSVTHRAFKAEKPGRVELWPLIETPPKSDDTPWFEPLDRPSENDPRQILARQIATWIDETIRAGRMIEAGGIVRPVQAGDFLILVQSRAPLFRAIIKELKAHKLNVAGADRLKVGDELAVKDILSLLKFAATPEDDLSLAETLRSPLLNIGEGELFTLAHRRTATLWQSFRAQKTQFAPAAAILDDVLVKADWMRPYELIERILTRHKGRENLLDRLGEEAEDGINELLSQALHYEQVEAPTLTGFLNWFASGTVELKREMDAASGQIRVMTVHGAKGLEAPIVILPDTVGTSHRDRAEVVPLRKDLMAWKTSASEQNMEEKSVIAEKRNLALQEKLRLLYVAMTRAETWLVVCGAGKPGNEPALNWYSLVEKGMENTGAVLESGVLALQNEYWADQMAKPETIAATVDVALPHWVTSPAPTPKAKEKTLSPSDLGGAKALPSELDGFDEVAAMRRGSLIHLLLEHMPGTPKTDWEKLAENLIQSPNPAEVSALLDIAARVLNTDALTPVFKASALTEVKITAPLPELGGRRILGTIDRLIVRDTSILAVDFKSNRRVPETQTDVPIGLLRQMGAYLSALQIIYPTHNIEVALLWTQNQQLMPLPHDLVLDALKTSTIP